MNVLLAFPLAAALSIRFRRRFEETIAPAIFLMIIALYFSGIFTTLLPGVAACLAMSVTALVYCMIRWKKEFLSGILTPGMLAFLLFAIFFVLVNIERGFSARDDFGHWALAVKNYLYYNDFSNIAASTDRNGTYPPAATLWNYLGALLFPRNGSFFVNRSVTPLPDAAGAQFFSQEMLEAALYLPVFTSVEHLSGRRNGRTDTARFLILLLAFPLLITGCYEVWFSSVMVDPLLGLCAGYILWMFLHTDRRDAEEARFSGAAVCGALFILTLTKEMGIVLAGLLAVIGPLSLPGRYDRNTGSDGRRPRRGAGRIRSVAVYLMSVGVALISWYGYLAVWTRLEAAHSTAAVSNGAGGSSARTAALGGHVGTILFKMGSLDPQLSWDVFRTYCYALFNSRRAPYGAILPVSFSAMMFLCAFLVLIVTVRRVQSGSFTAADRNFCRLFAGAWIAGWMYSLCLGIAYVTVFRNIAVTLPSMGRYLAPVIVMLFMLMIGFLAERAATSEPRRLAVMTIGGILLLLLYGDPGRLLKGLTVREDRQLPISSLTEDIRREGVRFESGDRVYLLKDEEGLSDVRYAFGYLVMPARINGREFDLTMDGVTDPAYDYLYDAERPAGERLFRRNTQTGAWEDFQR